MPETSRPVHCREHVRYFNMSGPCVPGWDYMLPPEPRVPDALELIEQGRDFVVYAPWQTGKTTTPAALAKDLNEGGQRVAVLFSCERAREIRDDISAAEDLILHEIAAAAATQEFIPDTVDRDHLAVCLAESRVQRVIEPLLADSFPANSGLGHADDVSYVRDLGLMAERPSTRVANPIYKELIVRPLSAREITLLPA